MMASLTGWKRGRPQCFGGARSIGIGRSAGRAADGFALPHRAGRATMCGDLSAGLLCCIGAARRPWGNAPGLAAASRLPTAAKTSSSFACCTAPIGDPRRGAAWSHKGTTGCGSPDEGEAGTAGRCLTLPCGCAGGFIMPRPGGAARKLARALAARRRISVLRNPAWMRAAACAAGCGLCCACGICPRGCCPRSCL